jgi:hypothetical protein
VSQDFFLLVFSGIIFPQAPENKIRVITNFLNIRGYIRKSRFTIGINDIGGNSINNRNNIRLLAPYSELEEKNLSRCPNKIFKTFQIEDFCICHHRTCPYGILRGLGETDL